MKTFHRVCIKDVVLEDGDRRLVLTRGTEYLTSPEHDDGTVTVFSTYWGRVTADVFAGAKAFTKA